MGYNSRKSDELHRIGSIKTPNEWVNLRVEVVELYDGVPPSIFQKGKIADNTGECGVTFWQKSADAMNREGSLTTLEAGGTYALDGVVTDVYQGKPSVKIVRTSKVRRLDKTPPNIRQQQW